MKNQKKEIEPRVKGFIKKIDKSTVTFVCAKDWHYDPHLECMVSDGDTVTMRLPITRSILDEAIALSLDYVQFTIDNGEIIDIKKLKKPERPTELESTLRDKLRVTVDTLIKMKTDMGMVKESELIQRLYTEHGIESVEAKRIITQLIREGTIYYAREGYLEKT